MQHDGDRMNCQAQPLVARRGFREDRACANNARTAVRFYGRDVPVCKIHESIFSGWGDAAEMHAQTSWGWLAQPASAPVDSAE